MHHVSLAAQDSQLVCAQTTTTIAVRTNEGQYNIDKHIYGHFAEHLGRCIYGGFYVGEDNQQIQNNTLPLCNGPCTWRNW